MLASIQEQRRTELKVNSYTRPEGYRTVGLVAAVLALGMAPLAHATVIDLYSTADAEITGRTVGSEVNTYNWGGLVYLAGNLNRTGGPQSTNSAGPLYFPTSGVARGLFQFDLSSIPAGSTINSVTASLYIAFNAFSPAPRISSVTLSQVTSAWTETGVTYDGISGALSSTSLTSMSVPSGTGPNQGGYNGYINGSGTNLTNLVQGWLDGTTPNYGLVTSDVVASNGLLRIYSREATGTANDPRLRIDYTPNAAPVADAGSYGPLNFGGSVNLIGSGTDANGDAITGYDWDLNNDGTFGDFQAQTLALSQADALGLWGMSAGDNTIQLKVMDEHGLWSAADPGIVTVTVPEPAVLAMLALSGLTIMRRRRKA